MIAILLPTVLWSDPANPFVWITVFSTLAFGAIGFADDYIKVVKRRSLGLTARAKLLVAGAGRGRGGIALVVLVAVQALFHAVDGALRQESGAPICCGTGPAPFRTWACWRFCPFSSLSSSC